MSEPKFGPGDTVYVAFLRINEDEVDWDVIRATCRGYKVGTSKPAVIADRGDGRWIMEYEENCFAGELDCCSRLLFRLTMVQDRCSDQSAVINRRGLDILAARAKGAKTS